MSYDATRLYTSVSAALDMTPDSAQGHRSFDTEQGNRDETDCIILYLTAYPHLVRLGHDAGRSIPVTEVSRALLANAFH